MKRILPLAVASAAFWLTAHVDGQPFRMVKDIAEGSQVRPYGSHPTRLTVVGNQVFFAATTGTEGRELWKSDGTAEGTVLVEDIFAGRDSFFLDDSHLEITALGTTVFFGTGNTNGESLWKSDGTPEATVPLGLSYLPRELTAAGGLLLFVGADVEHGRELWKSDGTVAGTSIVKDIVAGPDTAIPVFLTEVQGHVLFFLRLQLGLWKSDGTEAGTLKVADLGVATDLPPLAIGSKLYFHGCNASSQCGLWVYDDATSQVTFLTTMIPTVMARREQTLFFVASDTAHGAELWKSDGTAVGTVLVKDIQPGPTGSSLGRFVESNGILYFVADAGNGLMLWKTNGTDQTTVPVATMPGYPTEMIDVQGTLFFSVQGSLWKSDGTQAGTKLVKAILPGPPSDPEKPPGELTALGNLLLFAADDDVHGRELWRSDGTEAGTFLLKDVDPEPISSDPDWITASGKGIYFSADDGVHGRELWRSDGTASGTYLVKDLNVGGSSFPSGFLDLNGKTLFTATDAEGYKLWQTDGSETGTVVVKDIALSSLTPYKDFVVAVGPDGIWKTDGTETGTVHVDTGTAMPVTSDETFVEFEGALFFFGLTGNHFGLWKTDATTAGTQLVRSLNSILDIDPYGGPVFPSSLTVSGSLLYFVAFDADTGLEVWKSDGTTAGTGVVKDIAPGPLDSSPTFLTDVNGTLFFVAAGVGAGWELWKTDGTAAGTINVKNICSECVFGSFPQSLVNFEGTLFFSAEDSEHGRELWKSDGTGAGTILVRDIREGKSGSEPQGLINVGGLLFFAASDGIHGMEIWQSNGTETGTTLLADIHPGPGSFIGSGLTVSGSQLFFSASDGVHGSELWTLVPGTIPIPVQRTQPTHSVGFRPSE